MKNYIYLYMFIYVYIYTYIYIYIFIYIYIYIYTYIYVSDERRKLDPADGQAKPKRGCSKAGWCVRTFWVHAFVRACAYVCDPMGIWYSEGEEQTG